MISSPVTQEGGPAGVGITLGGVKVAKCVYKEVGSGWSGGRVWGGGGGRVRGGGRRRVGGSGGGRVRGGGGGRVRGDKLLHPLSLWTAIQ